MVRRVPAPPRPPHRHRIGGVPYGVGERLCERLGDDPALDVARIVPSALAVELRAGRIDAALVSSIEGFRHPGYAAVDHIGICCRGPVLSVRAFRRGSEPIRTVGVDASSETSVALLRILLAADRLGDVAPEPRFERVAPTRRPDELPHDLVMMIGDPGLEADPGGREAIDLGAAWTDWTGLPFVFALWLIRPGADAADLAARLHAAWLRAKDRPRRAEEGGVHYAIGPDEHAGLARFAAEARRLGLCEPDCAPRFVAADAR